MFSIVNVIECD